MAYCYEPFLTISPALMLRGPMLPLFSKVKEGENVYWCRICNSFDADTNQTIRLAIVDFILSSCHILEAVILILYNNLIKFAKNYRVLQIK